jgi:hypothetical protein
MTPDDLTDPGSTFDSDDGRLAAAVEEMIGPFAPVHPESAGQASSAYVNLARANGLFVMPKGDDRFVLAARFGLGDEAELALGEFPDPGHADEALVAVLRALVAFVDGDGDHPADAPAGPPR